MELKDITPEHMKCGETLTCPSVYKTEEGDLLIIGKNAADIADKEGLKIADDEYAIVIDPALLANLAVW